MTVAEVNTVYKATTTKAIQDWGKWPRRFILIAAVLLVILGTVIIALSTLVCDAGLDAESSLDGSNNNSKINSTGEPPFVTTSCNNYFSVNLDPTFENVFIIRCS